MNKVLAAGVGVIVLYAGGVAAQDALYDELNYAATFQGEVLKPAPGLGVVQQSNASSAAQEQVLQRSLYEKGVEWIRQYGLAHAVTPRRGHHLGLSGPPGSALDDYRLGLTRKRITLRFRLRF
jgi:hypothetical protein